MIVYCGLRHFYIHHFQPPQPDTYYILTYNNLIWDFSPKLKQHGLGTKVKPQINFHLEKPVLTIPINLTDFQLFTDNWYDFSRQYTSELEPEYPHSWYLRFQQKAILLQFLNDFQEKAIREFRGSISGAGTSKLVAKLAAHNLTSPNNIIEPQHTECFLNQISLQRLPIAEAARLNQLGIGTIGALAYIPFAELSNQFGKKASALQKLGRGEDTIPFRAQQETKFSWTLNCTGPESSFTPLKTNELEPYIKQGLEELVATLQANNKVVSILIILIKTTTGQWLEAKRHFKTPTNDYGTFLRTVQNLIPMTRQSLAKVRLIMGELQPSPTIQLNMFAEPVSFWPPQAPKLSTQKGIKLTRRERVLLLWEEYFEHE